MGFIKGDTRSSQEQEMRCLHLGRRRRDLANLTEGLGFRVQGVGLML